MPGNMTVPQSQTNESKQELDIRPRFVIDASIKYQRIWENLTPAQQQLLENQASLRDLNSKEKIDRFFESRDFDLMTQPRQTVSRYSKEMINETSQEDSLAYIMNSLRS